MYVRFLALLILAGLAGCTASRPPAPAAEPEPVARAGCAEERVYAVLLSTRKHQLSGRNPTVGVFHSADGGASWTHAGWPQGRHFAVMAPPGGCGDTLFIAAGNGVFRTRDGGRTWRITTGWEITEVQDLTIDPTRPSRVFAATPYGVFRSDDGGQTWRARSEGLTSAFVASVRADRTQPGRVFAGTESGLYLSTDGGDRWEPTAVTDPVRSIRQSPADPMRWVIGLQGRGVALSSDGGRTWRYGEGAVAALTVYESEFHPDDPDRLYAGGWQTGVVRSNDFGRSWTIVRDGLGDGSVHSLAVSRARPGLVFAGTMGGGLYRSEDDGQSWQPVAPDVFEASQVWDLYVEGEQ